MANRKSQGGAGRSAVSTQVSVLSGTAQLAVGTNLTRQRLDLWVAGATQIHVDYGIAATSTLSRALASQFAPLAESNYVGPVYLAVPSGASSAARVLEVSA